MKILYKLTTRSRPQKMFDCIQNIRAMALEKDPLIVLTLDTNDRTVNTADVRRQIALIPNVIPVFGYSKNKLAAFNRDVPAEGWDVIVATSDDIKFLHGFDEQIKKDAEAANYYVQADKNQPNGWDPMQFDFVLWYGDGFPHGKILTVPIMTRKYYQRLGYIYNPIYTSLFADEEAIYVGENLQRMYYSTAEIMVHMHPAWGKAEWDAQYRFTDSFYPADKKIFERRKAANFPL